MQTDRDQTAAYRTLVAAYHKAYSQAEQVGDLNRALIFNYIATSSRAVASEIYTILQEPELAQEADDFAKAAEEKDQVRKGLGIGKFLWKLVPGSAVIAVVIAAGGFLIALVSQANHFGENLGAGFAGVALSGSVLYFIIRAGTMAAQGAAKASERLGVVIEAAFASNAGAKRVVREVGPSEAQFLGAGSGLRRAQRGRLVVDLTGPATGVALTCLIAIPLVVVAVALAGVASGYQSNQDPSPFPSGYEYTPPTFETTPHSFESGQFSE